MTNRKCRPASDVGCAKRSAAHHRHVKHHWHAKLTGANDFTGNTIINAGTLLADQGTNLGALNKSALITVNNGGTLKSGSNTNSLLAADPTATDGAIVVNTGGTLDTNGSTTATTDLRSLTLAGGTLAGADASCTLNCSTYGRWTFNQGVTVTENSTISALNVWSRGVTINVSTGKTLTVGGTLVGNTGSFTKTGAGTMTLTNAANTYGGTTTINAGELRVNGSKTGTGTVTVNSGGTLAGTGSVTGPATAGGITVNNGGHLRGGIGSGNNGTLTINGGLTLAGGAILDVANQTSPLGTFPSKVAITTNLLTAASGALTVNLLDAMPAAVGPHTLINKTNLAAAPGITATLGTHASEPRTPTFAWPTNTGLVMNMSSPDTITIVAAGTGTSGVAYNSGTGTYTTTASNARIDVGDLTANLGTTNVTIDNTTATSTDIIVGTDVVYAGSAHGLTLRTNNDIKIDHSITSTNALPLTLIRGVTATTGKVTCAGGETINTGGGLLTFDATGVSTTENQMDCVIAGSGGVTSSVATKLAGVNTAARTLTLSNMVSGSGNLTKTGSGTAIFSGVNDYTGATTISAGTLRVSNASALGTTADDTTVNSGGTLDLYGTTAAITVAEPVVLNGGTLRNSHATYNATLSGTVSLTASTSSIINVNTAARTLTLSNMVSGSGNLTKTGSGVAIFSEVNDFTNVTTISAGTIRTTNTHSLGNNSSVALSSTAASTLDLYGQNLTIGSLTGGSGTVGTVTNTAAATTAVLTVGNADSTTDAGLVSGTAANVIGLTKVGGGTLTLTRSNTYYGPTTINAGILSIPAIANGGSTSPIGRSASTASNLVLGGGTLQYTGATASTNRAFTLTNVTTSTIEVTNGATNLTLSGASAATTGGLTKGGTGTLILSGANSYTGATRVSAGTLRAGAAMTSVNGPFGNCSAVTLDTVSTLYLELYGRNVAIGSLAGGNAGNGVVRNNSATAATLTTGCNGNGAIFSGILQNGSTGALSLIKTGNGIQILSGANTYTGATAINGGELQFNGINTGTSVKTVAGGATLAGIGTIPGGVTVNGTSGGGHLRGGTGSGAAGTLTINGALTFNSGAVLDVTSAGSGDPSLVDVGGNTLTTSTLAVKFINALPSGSGPYTLIRKTSGTLPTTLPTKDPASAETRTPTFAWTPGTGLTVSFPVPADAAKSGARVAIDNQLADGAALNTLEALIRDAGNNRVNGATVTFERDDALDVTFCEENGAEPCISNGPKTCATVTDGTCRIAAKSSVAGLHKVRVTVGGDALSGGTFYVGEKKYGSSPVSSTFVRALSGVVFEDNGAGTGGVAHNGVKDGAEAGLSGVKVTLAHDGGADITSTSTAANGGYSFDLAGVSGALKVSAAAPEGRDAISEASALGTIGSQTDGQITAITAPVIGVAGVNFGQVKKPSLPAYTSKMAQPGIPVYHPLTFQAYTSGSVLFTTGNIIATPASGWTEALVKDSNCDGQITSGESAVVSGSVDWPAGTRTFCLAAKITAPAGAPTGSRHSMTVTGEITYTNAISGATVIASRNMTAMTTVGEGVVELHKAAMADDRVTPKETAAPGDIITYILTYRNPSSKPVTNVVVTDAIPAYTTYVDASAQCLIPWPQGITACDVVPPDEDSDWVGPITWTLDGQLRSGAEGKLEYQVQVDQ